MEKVVVLLGVSEPGSVPRARGELRDALLARAPALQRAGAYDASIAVADLDDPRTERVAQLAPGGCLDAVVSFWLDSLDARAEPLSLFAPLAQRSAAYLVTESVPRAAAACRERRLPGVALATAFAKPGALSDDDFYARWHGSHTPLSLEIHPLLRYVRNAVARPLTPGAPPVRGIVLEAVESLDVLLDPARFYGSEANRRRAVKDLLSFTDLASLDTVLMSEYRLDL